MEFLKSKKRRRNFQLARRGHRDYALRQIANPQSGAKLIFSRRHICISSAFPKKPIN
jgi:hypothetical protein